MWPNLQFPVDLVTFNEKILNGKLHILCSVKGILKYQTSRRIFYTVNFRLVLFLLKITLNSQQFLTCERKYLYIKHRNLTYLPGVEILWSCYQWPKALRKLCVSTKIPYQEVRAITVYNSEQFTYSIIRGECYTILINVNVIPLRSQIYVKLA